MSKIARVMIGATALAASAVAASGATANAAPATTNQSPASNAVTVQILPGVEYTGDPTTQSTRIVTPIGTVTSAGSQFAVQDAQGKSLWGNTNASPAPATSTDRVATRPAWQAAPSQARTDSVAAAVQPVSNVVPATPVDKPTAGPVDQQSDFEGALGMAATNFGLASGVGSTIGGVTGALIGCPLGVVTGGALTAPTVVLTPLGAAVGCVVGIATVGGAGALVGGAALGIPVGIASAVQMYNTLHAKGEA
ncbi:hypothetical protein K7711_10390 [Nocardia sp. CA2R105]|uniref:hypothetical protein n=1 Tax=Nocardia coffeae TaxID=2873381 RepID=UPI001CA668C7|nr:hypothetical protein [Nocardia coffeae]MBY8856885.1 hypothetical protein [Nocardia coffeae]